MFALGVGGLAGALSETPFAGGGRLAGTLAQMLKDVLGTGMGAVLMGAIAVPGLFLALAPLVIEASKAGAAREAGEETSGGTAAERPRPERSGAPLGERHARPRRCVLPARRGAPRPARAPHGARAVRRPRRSR